MANEGKLSWGLLSMALQGVACVLPEQCHVKGRCAIGKARHMHAMGVHHIRLLCHSASQYARQRAKPGCCPARVTAVMSGQCRDLNLIKAAGEGSWLTSPLLKRMTLMSRFSRTMVHMVVQYVSRFADTASSRLISTGKDISASAIGEIIGALHVMSPSLKSPSSENTLTIPSRCSQIQNKEGTSTVYS